MQSGKIFIAFLFLLIGWQSAWACKCDSTKKSQKLIEEADLIFEGTVNYVNTNWMSGGWKYSFEVKQTWKRPSSNHLIINTKWEKDCGYIFEKGKTYLVYAKKTFGLKTDACMGNKLLSMASSDLEILGEALPTQPGGSQDSFMGLTLIILTVSSMIFLAFVVLRKKKP